MIPAGKRTVHSLALVLTLTMMAAAITTFARGAAPAAAETAKSTPDPNSAADPNGKKAEPKWDVNAPPGDWTEVSIDTQETTWSSVDVSPDGRTIVFDMLGDIYRVPIEGGEATSLSGGIPWDFQPRYSPDGKRIAFVSDRDGAENIWVMDADGANPKQISDEDNDLVHNPSWSPDGAYIVAKKGFMSTRSIAAGEIWIFNAGGGKGLQLTERPNGAKDQKNMAEPAFSVDGRYVYYSQDTTAGRVWQYNKDATGQIFVIQRLDRTNGKTETFVAGPGGSIRPTPSPDGKYLAFVRRVPDSKSALFLKDLQTGVERPIYDKLDRDLQETNGSTGNAPAFAWTPDGRSLVFWAARTNPPRRFADERGFGHPDPREDRAKGPQGAALPGGRGAERSQRQDGALGPDVARRHARALRGAGPSLDRGCRGGRRGHPADGPERSLRGVPFLLP